MVSDMALERMRLLVRSVREGRAHSVIFFCDSLESIFVNSRTSQEPDSDVVRQNSLIGGSVKGHQQFTSQVVLPEYPQKMQTLLGLFGNC